MAISAALAQRILSAPKVESPLAPWQNTFENATITDVVDGVDGKEDRVHFSDGNKALISAVSFALPAGIAVAKVGTAKFSRVKKGTGTSITCNA